MGSPAMDGGDRRALGLSTQREQVKAPSLAWLRAQVRLYFDNFGHPFTRFCQIGSSNNHFFHSLTYLNSFLQLRLRCQFSMAHVLLSLPRP